jgi:hypothetical protein
MALVAAFEWNLIRDLNGYIRAKFLIYYWEDCMQGEVEFGFQLSTCSLNKEDNEEPN